MTAATKPRRRRHLIRLTCYIGGIIALDRDRFGGRLCWVEIRQWDNRAASAVITPSMARKLAASLDVFADDGDPLSPHSADESSARRKGVG